MQAIMMSTRPRHVCNILNLIKWWEIRKMFPKDYVGWIYLYCTKDSKKGWCMVGINGNETYYQKYEKYAAYSPKHNYMGNGKVVARFWCDKVEEIIFGTTLYNDLGFFTGGLHDFDLYKQSCLTKKEMQNYLKVKPNGLSGYAIHITKLEIFDKPKELSEFSVFSHFVDGVDEKGKNTKFKIYKQLNRAPQSWCYVEEIL